jgi:Universal stress protein family
LLVDAGHPADRLVAAAADEEASLIVVGSTGPRSSLLGSISAEVSRRAPCPVVVVAPGADGWLANGRDGTKSANGHGRTDSTPRTTGFPSLLDDGYTDVDPSAPDYDGGIVRFSLSSRANGN